MALLAPVASLSAAQVQFLRGDVNIDGTIQITDVLLELRYLFQPIDRPLSCIDAADFDDDGSVDLADAILLLNYLYRGGAPPPAPSGACGPDPTADDIDCEDYALCSLLPEDDSGSGALVSGLDSRPPNGACSTPERPVSTANVKLEQVFGGLSLIGILDMKNLPGSTTYWYLARKPGYIYRFSNTAGVTTKSTVLTLTDRVKSTEEGGLLGFAFHPSFASNGYMYVYYTREATPLVAYLSRFKSSDGGATFDPGSETVLMAIDQPTVYHHGGCIAFGKDNYLYVGVGDGGISSKAGDTSAIPGKILRLNVDGGSPYGIPPGNPFASGGGRGEIFVWGVRNPWRFSIDRQTGELWVGDVGNNGWEEVTKAPAGSNCGWPIREGAHCVSSSGCSTAGLLDPIAEYSHTEGNCVVGGYRYRGAAIAGFQGTYLFGDWGTGKIWALRFDASGNATRELVIESGLRILSFAEGNDGEIYVLSGDKIHKVVANGTTGGTTTFPQKLSETGFFSATDPKVPSACLIPYDLNSPLWSDGAAKRRWMFIPDGKQLHIRSDGDWDFPIGTVLVKDFSLASKLIETRLLIRHSDGEWAGYSYEWNDAQTDATLLASGKTKLISGQTWTYPGRSECLQCHTEAANRVLGPETAQLNRSLTYPQTGRTANQLATLSAVGLFDAPLSGDPMMLPALANPADTSRSAEDRARAYLHSNCSHCHRPDGGGRGSMDLRYTTAWEDLGPCNADPVAGDLGVSGAKLLVPGAPSQSLISLRMHTTGTGLMPPLARSIVDPVGVAAIDAWISSITECPPPPGGGGQEVILDDGDPGTSSVGSWTASGGAGYYGVKSLYSRSAGAKYVYTASLAASGEYEVYAWWTQYSSRIANVPISIQHSTGTDTVEVDQRSKGGQWNLLGTWAFGLTGKVTVLSLGGGSTCADAIRWVPITQGNPNTPIVMDNGDPGTTFLGNWSPSGGAGFYGVNSLYSKSLGLWYRYTFDLPHAGNYEVQAWWTQWPSRRADVPIVIQYQGGEATIPVNQQANGAQWNSLGTFPFGSQAVITIQSLGVGSTCADAMRLIPAD